MHQKFVYKICNISLWHEAQHTGIFRGEKIDLRDGFIHFSTATQLHETLALHFVGRKKLCLLKIDTSGLDIVWELARKDTLFPHLYSTLPLQNIVEHHSLEMLANGYHMIPEIFLSQS